MKMRHLAKSRLKNDDDGVHADGCSRRARPPGKPISRRAMSRGEREMDARESASERDDAEMSDSDEETPGGDDGLRGKDLYEILGLTKEATASEIKKAYHKAALRLHPDKNPSPDAAGKFQTLQKVYGVLGDAEKRKVYDETGRVDDAELSGEKFNSLYEYYRGIYRKVTEEDIDDFFRTYRGGDEESKDIVDAYVKFEGDMSKVFMWVMCSDEATDAHRFADVVDDAVARGDAPAFPEFERWAKKTRERPAPKRPLEPREKKKKTSKKGAEGEGDLAALILARRDDRAARAEDLFASLEAKYGGKKAGTTKAKGGVEKKTKKKTKK